jgi:hypothetical protein
MCGSRALRNRAAGSCLFGFDLLMPAGEDLRRLPLEEKARLACRRSRSWVRHRIHFGFPGMDS